MSKPRPDIRPRHVYWVLLGVLLASVASQVMPRTGPFALLLYLFTIFSLILRWRFPLSPTTMLADMAVVIVASLFAPSNVIFLPIFVFYFCVHNKPAFTIVALVMLARYGSNFSWWLTALAIVSGYLLFLWEKQRVRLENEVDSLRQHLHEMTQTEEHLLTDQYATEQVSRLLERQRIAEILHDNLGFELTAALLSVKAAGTLLTQHQFDKALESQQKAEGRLANAMTQLKTAVRQIEPQGATDLGRITNLVESFVYPVQFSCNGDMALLPAYVRQLLFVSLQEALTNISKHAQPITITLSLEITQAIVRAVIENDGLATGEPATFGSGLRYMRRRIEAINGSLSIQKGETFRLIMILPLKE
ncbi:MAG: hypothetical protein A2Y31_10135 [Spirochaetes bacterium GWC2_52_13]|nr:MAG: hypothetical protein A2Y31_10135 [Spirochaetes bacterium GWC2_52_13]HCG62942.1 hypothetical protein [Sphaerochaeta sp.]